MSDLENSLRGAKLAYKALEDKKAVDITVLSIHEISVLSDYFVIATGNNPNQIKTMAEEVSGVLHKEGFTLGHSEGYQSSTWILLDFGSIIVHIFNKEDRNFYNIERIWADATRLDPDTLTEENL